jgi:signal transduction histidine kinase/CheY-like chemotaxis protein
MSEITSSSVVKPERKFGFYFWMDNFARPYWLLVVALFIAFVAGHSPQPLGAASHCLLAFFVGCALWLERQARRINVSKDQDLRLLNFSAVLTGVTHLLIGFSYVVFNKNDVLALTILTLMNLFCLAATISLNSRPVLWVSIAAATAVTCLAEVMFGHSMANLTIAAATLIGLAIQGNQLRDLHLRRLAHDRQQSANFDLIHQLETERLRSDELRLKAEEASRAKTRFMAAASHDLRQPLAALSLYAESLNHVARGTSTKEIAVQIDLSVGHLEKMFNALLDLSKLDAGVVQADIQRLPLQEIMPRIDREFRDHAHRKGLQFECHGPDIWLDTDPILFERIIRNLTENALRYTKTGSVNIQWREHQGQVIIEIRDTGVGIAPSERDRIFDEYYQIERTSRDRSAGLGIGLAIVRRLAQLLGFDVVLESAMGAGSCFRFIGKCAARPLIEAVEQTSEAHQSRQDLKGLRLLVIDDDPQIRQAAQLFFEIEQAHVQVAANHMQAMQAFAGEGADLVIADYRLGDGESGLDVLNALRMRQPSLPAMIITGDTGPEPLNLVLASGYRIVHKPISGAALVAHVRALLGDARGQSYTAQDRRASYRF